jgi:2'-5' RNA ligase
LRSFIAIELPETVKSALAELQQELKKCGADIRWIKLASIHLTLKFLGNIEDKVVENIVKVIKGTCEKYSEFNLDIKGVGVFPNIKSPRVIWVGVNSNTAISGLQNEIEGGMSSLGFERENRKFTPHLTLGRFRSYQGKASLVDKIESYKDTTFGIMDVNSVSLIKSDLSPAGAKYTRLANVALGK